MQDALIHNTRKIHKRAIRARTTIREYINANKNECFPGEVHIPNNMKIKIRSYWSGNSGAHIFYLPDSSEGVWKTLLTHLNAQDIVSMTGVSIIGASRETVAANGPEFYYIPVVASSSLRISHKTMIPYLENKGKIICKFVKAFRRLLIDCVSAQLTKIESKSDARMFLSKAKSIVHKTVERIFQEIKVSIGDHQYGFEEVSSMIQSDIPTHRRNIMDADAFQAHLSETIHASIGSDVVEWIGCDASTVWFEVHKDGRATDSRVLIGNKLGAFMKNVRPCPRRDIFRYISAPELVKKNGARRMRREQKRDAIASRIGLLMASPPKSTESPRSSLFEDLHNLCPACQSYTCEDAKGSSRIGQLLDHTNPSVTQCPTQLFNNKMKEDASFSKYVKRMERKIANIASKIPDGIHCVAIGHSGIPFKKRNHCFSMKKLVSARGESRNWSFVTERNQTEFSMQEGNCLASKRGKSMYVEHIHNKVPNVLFLLNTKI